MGNGPPCGGSGSGGLGTVFDVLCLMRFSLFERVDKGFAFVVVVVGGVISFVLCCHGCLTWVA